MWYKNISTEIESAPQNKVIGIETSMMTKKIPFVSHYKSMLCNIDLPLTYCL